MQRVKKGCETGKVPHSLVRSSPAMGPAAMARLSPKDLNSLTLQTRVAFSKQSLACAKPGIVCSWTRLQSRKGLYLHFNIMEDFRAELMSVLWLCLVCYCRQTHKVYKRKIRSVSSTAL